MHNFDMTQCISLINDLSGSHEISGKVISFSFIIQRSEIE